MRTPGGCFCCDEMCFEVMARWDEGEKRAGLPKRLGPPLPGATLVQFELYDGSRCDITFCKACVDKLGPSQYPGLWKKVILNWRETLEGAIPDWVKKSESNGILIELRRVERLKLDKSEATGAVLA